MTRHHAANTAGEAAPNPPNTAANTVRGAAVLTEAEAAKELRLSIRSLQRYRVIGGGPPYVRLGERRIGYRTADIDAWVASRLVNSTSAATVAKQRAA